MPTCLLLADDHQLIGMTPDAPKTPYGRKPMPNQVKFELTLLSQGGDITIELTNGHLQTGLFKMGIYDTDNHLLYEPLPASDPDTGSSRITRELPHPGVELRDKTLKAYGIVIAPRPGAGQLYAVTLKVGQMNGNNAQGTCRDMFDEVEPVMLQVTFK